MKTFELFSERTADFTSAIQSVATPSVIPMRFSYKDILNVELESLFQTREEQKDIRAKLHAILDEVNRFILENQITVNALAKFSKITVADFLLEEIKKNQHYLIFHSNRKPLRMLYFFEVSNFTETEIKKFASDFYGMYSLLNISYLKQLDNTISWFDTVISAKNSPTPGKFYRDTRTDKFHHFRPHNFDKYSQYYELVPVKFVSDGHTFVMVGDDDEV